MILPLTKEKLLEVLEIENDCFITPYTKNLLVSTIDSPCFIGFYSGDNGVDGYILSSVVLDEANLDRIAVKKDKRNNQIGKKLIMALEDALVKKGISSIFLEVRVSNAVAISLYEKMGFERINVRKKYYENTEDAIVMKKVLRSEN